jgi:hypothetical protein
MPGTGRRKTSRDGLVGIKVKAGEGASPYSPLYFLLRRGKYAKNKRWKKKMKK